MAPLPEQAPTPQEVSPRDAVARAVGLAWELAASGALGDAAAAPLLEQVEAAFGEGEDAPALKAVLQSALSNADRLRKRLDEWLRRATEAEARLAGEGLYTEGWWERKRLLLRKLLEKDAGRGARRWLQVHAELLVAWELDLCDRLAREPMPLPDKEVALIRQGTGAIHAGDYPAAIEMLANLALNEALYETTRALLLLFLGRIHLKRPSPAVVAAGDEEGPGPLRAFAPSPIQVARECFQRALDLAPKDGRPHAGFGDAARVTGDGRGAMVCYRRATELSPDEPEGHLGMGACLEDQNLWDEAGDCYARAINALRARPEGKDLNRKLGRLLAPASANAYLELARVLKKEGDFSGALTAAERALQLGPRHEGLRPERLAYRLKAEALEGLNRPKDAARAYAESGSGFSERGEQAAAIDLLRRAVRLDEEHGLASWLLADALRVSSWHPKPPHVGAELARESQRAWEAGARKKLPGEEDAWAYTVRALINEQIAKLSGEDEQALWWEATVYLERALLLRPDDSYAWNYLGRFHRFLNNHATSLRATARALEDQSAGTSILDERASSLGDAGRIQEAEAIVDRRLAMPSNEPKTWLESVKSYLLLSRGEYKDAWERLDRVLAVEVDVWYLEYRARCSRMLARQAATPEERKTWLERAQEDDRRIWELSDDPAYSSMKDYQLRRGVAAYHLGEVDRAIECLAPLKDDPIHCGGARRTLGLCYLGRGELDRARASLAEGIREALNATELDAFVREEIGEVEQEGAARTGWPEVKKLLDELRRAIEEARRAALLRPPSVQEELEKIVHRWRGEDSVDAWKRLSARAALGRLFLDQKRWSDAAEAYKGLLAETQRTRGGPGELSRFPEAEARLGLSRALRLRDEERKSARGAATE